MKQGLNIHLRKDGRYEGRIPVGRNVDGSLRYRSIYNRDETTLRAIMETEYENGPAYLNTHKMRFNTLFDLWLQYKETKVRESTLSIYRCHVDAHLRPLLGNKFITSMTSDKLNEFFDTALAMRNDGRGELSAKSRCDILRTLNNVLKFAMSRGYILLHVQTDYPKIENKKMNVLRENEQAALETVLQANWDEREALGVYLCLYTGLRVGELCGLTWEDFDFEEDLIFVQRTVQRIGVPNADTKTKILIGEPKSLTSKRVVPIPAHLIKILKKLKGDKCEEYFLSDTDKCFEPRRMQLAFYRYLDLAGLARRGIHCTRHTFATRWVELGVDIKTLSDILGHTGIRITLDKYVHISEKVKRDNINKITPLLSISDNKKSRQKPKQIPTYAPEFPVNM